MTIESDMKQIYDQVIKLQKMLLVAFPEKFIFKIKCPSCGSFEITGVTNYVEAFVRCLRCGFTSQQKNFSKELQL